MTRRRINESSTAALRRGRSVPVRRHLAVAGMTAVVLAGAGVTFGVAWAAGGWQTSTDVSVESVAGSADPSYPWQDRSAPISPDGNRSTEATTVPKPLSATGEASGSAAGEVVPTPTTPAVPGSAPPDAPSAPPGDPSLAPTAGASPAS